MPFRTAGECLPVLQPVPNPFPMVQDILLTSSNRFSPIRTVPYLLFSFPAELLPVIGQQGVIQRLDRFRPRYLPQVFDNMKSVRDAAALFQVRRRALYPRRPVSQNRNLWTVVYGLDIFLDFLPRHPISRKHPFGCQCSPFFSLRYFPFIYIGQPQLPAVSLLHSHMVFVGFDEQFGYLRPPFRQGSRRIGDRPQPA